MANIYIKYLCWDIASTGIYVRITLSRFDSIQRTELHYSQMHFGLVIWQEGVSPFTYIFLVCSGRQTFVQTSFTKGIIQVPHCVSNMNTHGSWKVTVLCFALECTRLIICYVDTCRCTIARLLICEGSSFSTLCFKPEYTWGIKVDFVVNRSWIHKSL